MRSRPFPPVATAIVIIGLAACMACASRAPTPKVVAAPPHVDVLAVAETARLEGRVQDALALLAQASDAAAPVPLRRDALMAQGLLRLDPTSPYHDVEAAWGLLAAALVLHDAPPQALVTAVHVAEQQRAQLSALRALELSRDEQAGKTSAVEARVQSLDDENRTLRRTVRQLRADLEQREAALRKAAQAVIGSSRSK